MRKSAARTLKTKVPKVPKVPKRKKAAKKAPAQVYVTTYHYPIYQDPTDW